MATISLKDIQDAAEKKYGSLIIDLGEGDTVELVNALRLSKEKRRALTALEKREGADAEDMLIESLRIVARDEHQANLLVQAVGDDLASLAEIMENYTKDTQVGEASPSQD